MESKYYTPTIDEFHVGFEYERTDINDEYYRGVSDIYDLSDVKTLFHKSNYFASGEYTKRIRVKYLDEEDIIECGFAKDFGWQEINPPFKFGNFYIFYDDDRIVISEGSPYIPDAIFIGTIKNKSELKRLMKQLGIV